MRPLHSPQGVEQLHDDDEPLNDDGADLNNNLRRAQLQEQPGEGEQ